MLDLNLEKEIVAEKILFQDEESLMPSDSEDFEGAKYNQMMDRIQKSKNLIVKKPKVFTESKTENEFNIDLGEVSLFDLSANLEDERLKKKISSVCDLKVSGLNAPAEEHANKKIEMKLAYEKLKVEVNKWSEIVKKNKKAKTISFHEKQSPAIHKYSLDEMNSKFTATDDFEKDFDNLLKGLNYNVQTHENLSKKDMKAKKRADREMQIERAKLRSRLFHQRIEFKRVKDIKSKKYKHKIKVQKKKQFEKLKKEGLAVEPDEDELLLRRAKERMNLRHKNTGKWAKRISKRPFLLKNLDLKSDLIEKDKIGRELRRRIKGEENDKDIESESKSNDRSGETKKNLFDVKDDIENEKLSGLFALSFMKKSLKKEEEKSKRLLESFEKEQVEKKPKDKFKINSRENKSCFREVKKNSLRPKSCFTTKISGLTFGGEKVNQTDSNKNIQKIAVVKEINPMKKVNGITFSTKLNTELIPKISKVAISEQNLFAKKEFDSESEEILSCESDGDSKKLHKEVNAITDVSREEFLKQQEEVSRKEKCEKEEDNTVVGWGSWAGNGIKRKKPRKKPIFKPKRKDLIINSVEINKNLEGVTIAAKPGTFKTEKAYANMISVPLGKQWNTTHDFKEKTKPRILVKRGMIIEPIKPNDSFVS